MNRYQSYNWLLYLVHIFVGFVILLPLAFALVSSFRPLDEIFRYMSPVSWKTFFPQILLGKRTFTYLLKRIWESAL